MIYENQGSQHLSKDLLSYWVLMKNPINPWQINNRNLGIFVWQGIDSFTNWLFKHVLINIGNSCHLSRQMTGCFSCFAVVFSALLTASGPVSVCFVCFWCGKTFMYYNYPIRGSKPYISPNKLWMGWGENRQPLRKGKKKCKDFVKRKKNTLRSSTFCV